MAVAEFISENRGGHIGLSSPRADGPLKVAVVTHKNAPEQASFTESDDMMVQVMGAKPALANDRILFHGQFVALVVAETFEAARVLGGLPMAAE